MRHHAAFIDSSGQRLRALNELLVADSDPALSEALRPRWFTDPNTYAVVRFVFLRLLGLIYAVAFLVANNQLLPLVGSRGLEPSSLFLRTVKAQFGPARSLTLLPTLFWINGSDAALRGASWAGLALAVALLVGFGNSITLFLLWILYLSIVQVGQVFWGYGWESLLLETGFLAIFLVSPWRLRPFCALESPPKIVIWLLRWLAFRLMLGAGLIKLRGDPCWRELTCLFTHYETQPLPNPLSWYLNQLPHWVNKAGVLLNHYAELIAPFLVFGPRPARLVGGLSIVVFQLFLILSGNLSWLNWLTITVTVACFDDRALLRICPIDLRERIAGFARAVPLSKARTAVVVVLAVLIGVLSINPVANLFSSAQLMNSSFEPLYLVNTYGAFGSVGRERLEILVEGTTDEDLEHARWSAYEFRCKPGDPARRPCIVAPYQYRIDWQMWFAAMSDYRHHPWIVHLVYKLLLGDPDALGLLAQNPFPLGPPKYVRADLYRYEFTRSSEKTDLYWKRERVAPYLPPLSADEPVLLEFLRRRGWLEP
jgi:hypothetical protein